MLLREIAVLEGVADMLHQHVIGVNLESILSQGLAQSPSAVWEHMIHACKANRARHRCGAHHVPNGVLKVRCRVHFAEPVLRDKLLGGVWGWTRGASPLMLLSSDAAVLLLAAAGA